MLHVKTPEEVLALIENEFSPLVNQAEMVPLQDAMGRILAADICAELDWLLYNAPMKYAQLVLSGEMGQYLSGPTLHGLED